MQLGFNALNFFAGSVSDTLPDLPGLRNTDFHRVLAIYRSYDFGIRDFLRAAKRTAPPRPNKANVAGSGTVTISMLQLTSVLW